MSNSNGKVTFDKVKSISNVPNDDRFILARVDGVQVAEIHVTVDDVGRGTVREHRVTGYQIEDQQVEVEGVSEAYARTFFEVSDFGTAAKALGAAKSEIRRAVTRTAWRRLTKPQAAPKRTAAPAPKVEVMEPTEQLDASDRAIRLPTQHELDSGRAPAGFHMERDREGGCVFVRDGWRATAFLGALAATPGEHSWNSWKQWPGKAERDAMLAEVEAEAADPSHPSHASSVELLARRARHAARD